MLMAACTGRLDLSIAGLFGAGKSRAAPVLLVGMLIVNPDVKVLVICKENSAAGHSYSYSSARRRQHQFLHDWVGWLVMKNILPTVPN